MNTLYKLLNAVYLSMQVNGGESAALQCHISLQIIKVIPEKCLLNLNCEFCRRSVYLIYIPFGVLQNYFWYNFDWLSVLF